MGRKVQKKKFPRKFLYVLVKGQLQRMKATSFFLAAAGVVSSARRCTFLSAVDGCMDWDPLPESCVRHLFCIQGKDNVS